MNTDAVWQPGVNFRVQNLYTQILCAEPYKRQKGGNYEKEECYSGDGMRRCVGIDCLQ